MRNRLSNIRNARFIRSFKTRSAENVFSPIYFIVHFDPNVFGNRFNRTAESKVTTVTCFTVTVFSPLLRRVRRANVFQTDRVRRQSFLNRERRTPIDPPDGVESGRIRNTPSRHNSRINLPQDPGDTEGVEIIELLHIY